MTNQNKLFDKYLNLLEVKAADPSFELLCSIVRAHLIKVPFENISKLLYKKQGMKNIPDLSTFLDGIEKYKFGGTCYSNNYYLYLLLQHLGYEIKLCGANMKNPDVHIINIITIDSHEFLADVGYAAPFFNPLPLDSSVDQIISSGVEKFILKPKGKNGFSKLEQYYNGGLKHWYTLKPQTKKIEEFRKVIEDSYSDDAVFINALRITRFTKNGSLVLRNLQLTETTGTSTSTSEVNLNDIPDVVEEKFGMPAEKVKEAVGTIKKLKDIFD